MLLLSHHALAPMLRPFVDCIWAHERDALPHARERGLPTGCVDLVIPLRERQQILRYRSESDAAPQHFDGAIVQGAHDRWRVRGIDGPSSVVGVHFRPGGAAALFGGALPELRNKTVLLEDLWGAPARQWREQLQQETAPAARLRRIEAELIRRLAAAPPPDRMIAAALAAWQRDPANAAVEPVQRASGCTPARFIRRFEAAVGLTPKRCARVLRFNALLHALVRQGPRDWASLAADAGYFDQSHLIHEFRRLAGTTPASYRPLDRGRPTHVPLPD